MADITQKQIEEWITEQATGVFHYSQVMDGQIDKKLYPQLRTIMQRCKQKGLVYPADKRDGYWRPADNTLDEIAWWESDGVQDNNVLLPLSINNLCMIPKPAIILLAGTYNAGKSAFCINTVKENQELWKGGKGS